MRGLQTRSCIIQSVLGKTTVSNFDDVQNSFVISVYDVFEAVQKQKKDNAAGFDAVHIKAFVYSGSGCLYTLLVFSSTCL